MAENQSKEFETAGIRSELPRRSVRSGAVVLGAQFATLVLSFGSAAVLARLLTPDDYGLVAMAAAFMAVINNLSDLGLPLAIVQREDVTKDQINALFWINVLVGFCAFILGALAAWPIAWYYGNPTLIPIVIALATAFIFNGLFAQHEAVLKRRMQFTRLSTVSIVALVVSIVAAIIAALLGAEYWALVVQALAMPVVKCVLLWLVASWRPELSFNKEGIRPLLRFGTFLTGTNLLGSVVSNLDKMVIGRVVGGDAVGYYVNASKLLIMPIRQLNAPLTNVAVPTLSRLQNEPERFRAFYRRGVESISAVTVPIVLVFMVSADYFVPAVLGHQWLPSIPLFKALSPAALLASVNIVTSWVFVPLGRSDRQFRWHFIRSVSVVIAIFIGINWGALGVAVAYSITQLLLRGPAILYCIHGTCIQPRDVFGSVWASFSAGAIAALLALPVANAFDPSAQLWVPLLAIFATFWIAYVIAWIALPGGLRRLRVMQTSLSHLLPHR